MIQINATTHTDFNGANGVTIPTGSVLDVFVSPMSRRVYDEAGAYSGTEHDIHFNAALFKSMASYKSTDPVLVNEFIKEYNINFIAENVDLSLLTTVDSWLELFSNHIENGNAEYPGVGVGNTAIVYP